MTPWTIEVMRMSGQFIKVRLVNEQSGEVQGPIDITITEIAQIITARDAPEPPPAKPSKIILP